MAYMNRNWASVFGLSETDAEMYGFTVQDFVVDLPTLSVSFNGYFLQPKYALVGIHEWHAELFRTIFSFSHTTDFVRRESHWKHGMTRYRVISSSMCRRG